VYRCSSSCYYQHMMRLGGGGEVHHSTYGWSRYGRSPPAQNLTTSSKTKPFPSFFISQLLSSISSPSLAPCKVCNGNVSSDCKCCICGCHLHCFCAIDEGLEGHGVFYLCSLACSVPKVAQNFNTVAGVDQGSSYDPVGIGKSNPNIADHPNEPALRECDEKPSTELDFVPLLMKKNQSMSLLRKLLVVVM